MLVADLFKLSGYTPCIVFVLFYKVCKSREVQETQRECRHPTGGHEERGWGISGGGSGNLSSGGGWRCWRRVPIETEVGADFFKHATTLTTGECASFNVAIYWKENLL